MRKQKEKENSGNQIHKNIALGCSLIFITSQEDEKTERKGRNTLVENRKNKAPDIKKDEE